MCRWGLLIGFKTNKTRARAFVAGDGGAFTSPRLRGEVGALARRVRGPLHQSELGEKPPHPDPLPASGEREQKAHRPVILALAAFALASFAAGAAYAEGDAEKGKAAFVRQCLICHTNDKGGENRFGPNLFGIIGRKAGTVPGYAYTNAFKTRANWEWTEDAIGGWMMFPSTMVPGTAMGVFQGIAEKDRDDLVAYLATLK